MSVPLDSSQIASAAVTPCWAAAGSALRATSRARTPGCGWSAP